MSVMTNTGLTSVHDDRDPNRLMALMGLMGLMTGDKSHGPRRDLHAGRALGPVRPGAARVARVRRRGPLDRFPLPKGHRPVAYYAVLAAKGFVPEEWLPGFGSYNSPLDPWPARGDRLPLRRRRLVGRDRRRPGPKPRGTNKADR